MVKSCWHQERSCYCWTSITPFLNDRFVADLGERLEQSFDVCERAHHWEIYAKLRDECAVINPAPGLSIQRIGELLEFDLTDCLPGAAPTCAANLQQE